MMEKIDKRVRAQQFRSRLIRAMEETATSQSALARQIGVDRSTISQLRNAKDARLPNAQVVAECAAALGVSSDWLLGLSERPEKAADLLAASATLSHAERALIDEQIFLWHKESAGYKIRHVPATLPDTLKTQAMLEWEYTPHLGQSAAQAIQMSQDRLAWMLSGQSDYEIAIPIDELFTFAYAEGYYRSVPIDIRRTQLAHMAALHDRFYPALRITLYDSRVLFSSPLTIFGPRLAVLYTGSHYVAFRDTERIRAFTTHFDGLVRQAHTPDRDLPRIIEELLSQIGSPQAP
ncbi:MAG: transcriptional regulator with XRE-family HTH domain [Paracoccaceae bacterium]|jgi:transcriptional regulator with XRE-family HTH domain